MRSVDVVELTNSQPFVGHSYVAPDFSQGLLRSPEVFDQSCVSEQIRVVNPDSAHDVTLCLMTDLETAREVWTTFQLSAWSTPFQSFDWVRSWYLEGSGSSKSKPVIILGYEGNDLKFILPLGVEPFFGVKRLCWLAGDINDYNCPLVAPEFASRLTEKMAAEIWGGIAKIIGGVDVFHLTKQPEFLAGVRNPFMIKGTAHSSCASHMLMLESDWKSLYRRLRSSRTRSRLRQKHARLRREGKLQFRSVRNQSERDLVIDTVLRWKGEQLEASGDRNPFSNFTLKQTIKTCVGAAPNSMRIYGLYLDNRLVAGIIAFVSGQTFSLFVTAYDPRGFTHCSPGTLLLLKILELSSRAGLKSFDFLAGDEPYKRDWCDQTLVLKDSFLSASVPGYIDVSLSHLRLKYKKILKSNPAAMDMLRRINYFKTQARALFTLPVGS